MERAVLLLKPEQRSKLADLAARARVSTAEIHRRAIDAYNPDSLGNSDLEQLADIVLYSHKKTLQAISDARKAVKEALTSIKKGQT